MTKFISSIIFLAFAGGGLTQEIREAKIKLDLPNDSWYFANKSGGSQRVVYVYKREPIADDMEHEIIPNIAVIVETIDKGTDAVTYSSAKRSKVPFDVDEVFIHDSGKIAFKNAVGYRAHYSDTMGMAHTIYVVHAVKGDKGLQIILDTTTNILDQVEPEFLLTLKSIRN